MKVMPPWMWLVLGVSTGALGFAAFSTYLAILAPLILMGLGFAYVAGEQRTARALQAAKEQRRLDQELVELDKVINEPDQELERQFKALADAETASQTPVPKDDPQEELGYLLRQVLLAEDSPAARRLLGEISERRRPLRKMKRTSGERQTETRQLYHTVRRVILKGNICCSLTRRPGRRVLIVQGVPSVRKRLNTNHVDEVLTITFDHEWDDDPILVEISSAALEQVEVGDGVIATIHGSFDQLTVVAMQAEHLTLEGEVSQLRLTAFNTSVRAEKMKTMHTNLRCANSDLHLSTQILTGDVLDDCVDVTLYGNMLNENTGGRPFRHHHRCWGDT